MPTISSYLKSILSLEVLENYHDSTLALRAIPLFPTDLFVATASLLDISGAYSFYDPDPDQAFSLASGFSSFTIGMDERSRLMKLGSRWKKSGADLPPQEIIKRWEAFIKDFGDTRARVPGPQDSLPTWWGACLSMLIASDEASEGIGHVSPSRKELRDALNENAYSSFDHSGEIRDGFQISSGSRATFAQHINSNLHAVFPKTMPSMVGCSHRNFSKNLAMLPRSGSVRCHWHGPAKPLKDDNERPMDILLIPYPFKIPSKSFTAEHDPKTAIPRPSSDNETRVGWSNFSIKQNWIDQEDPVRLAVSLLKSAKEDVDTVNGVVFPEYSLTYEKFLELCTELKKIEPGLEFVIAGTDKNCEKGAASHGNHVMTCVWHNIENDEEDEAEDLPSSADAALVTSRRKHHRWMLSPRQLAQYALTSSLDPRVNWWEAHNIGKREMHFFPFRKNSIFTSMICEDLARSDPCHEVLRSIGPNLVFVLLMDGPQIEGRWPARYASSLSDDPGCSVLTLTSFGLIDRSNKSREFSPQEAVAYFSSPFGSTPILLPQDGAKGILLTLTSELGNLHQTIDGRPDDGARTWRLTSTQPIYAQISP
jgi:hypothetical protein